MPRFSIQSPNGRVKLTVTLREGALHYAAEKDGVTVVDRSPLGLLLRQADLSCGLTLVSSNYASIQETYTLPAFKKSPCENHANTLTLLLEKHEETLQVEGRAYDDGVALRLIAGGEGNASVLGERTGFSIPAGAGDVYGMNIDATNHNANSAFWKRTLSTRDSGLSANGHRKFSPRGYLFPISQEEMDRTNCTQNYGW